MIMTKTKNRLLLLFLLCVSLKVEAGIIKETVSLTGNSIATSTNCNAMSHYNGLVEYFDPASVVAGYPAYTDLKAGYNVCFRYNDQLRTNFGYRAVRVIYQLRLKPDYFSSNTNSTVVTDTITIYLSRHTNYVDKVYKFYDNVDANPNAIGVQEAHYGRLCVLQVQSSTNYDINTEVATWSNVSGTLDNDYILDLNFEVERIFTLNTSTTATLQETTNAASCSTSVAGLWTCN